MTPTPLNKPGFVQREEAGLVVLSPASGRVKRRVIYVNSYGGKALWDQISRGLAPASHLYGCMELVLMGYEVALAEPLPDFYWNRRALPHDLKFYNFAQSWLGRDGVLYCGHNVLYWTALLKGWGIFKPKVVSLMFAREPLLHARSHSGVIAMTPAAEDHCRKLAPKVKVAHLGWGIDLDFYPQFPFQPGTFLSCGIANRDFTTLSGGAKASGQPIKAIVPGLKEKVAWPANVTVVDGGSGWNTDQDKKMKPFHMLEHYPDCLASLIVMKNDPTEYTANGFTNLLEAMAMSRAVIMTRTGALPGEIDVEKQGIGLFVPANDPQALCNALNELARNPERARQMGLAGRELCEKHYTIQRFGRDLDKFFDTL